MKPQPDIIRLGKMDDARWKSWGCPLGKPGDRLWVRETFYKYYPSEGWPAPKALYRADGIALEPMDSEGKRQRWTPSIHMPRALSRIVLEITAVYPERVQDITEDEAIKEGVVDPVMGTYGLNPKTVFRDLWNDIYAKRGLGWDVNPWIWVVKFKRMEAEQCKK